MRIDAGRLNRRVKLLRPTQALTESGAPVVSYAEAFERWCSRLYFAPAVDEREPQRQASAAVRLLMRLDAEPTLWDAGIRLMQAGNPEGWQAIVDAADMRQANRDTIAACEKAAAKAKEAVRCTIRIER